MRIQHVTAWGAKTLAVFIMALFLCPMLAYAATEEAEPTLVDPAYATISQTGSESTNSLRAGALDATAAQASLTGGDVSSDSAVYTQDMIGTVSRPMETIAINKNYSRNASTYDVHNYRFKSKGGAYTLKVNNKVKGSTSTLNVSAGGVVEGYLTVSVSTGKARKILYIGEWCRKGSNTFDLGTIKKGTTVNVSFLAYPRSSASKWTFKVERDKLKMKKSNTKITVKDVTWKGGLALQPTVTVKYKGKKLKKGTDYTLKYSNNTEVGTGKVMIKGKGNYSGSFTRKFKVKPIGKVYVLVYGAAKNEKPSSNHNVSIMKGALNNLKISGYEFKNNDSYRTVVNHVGFDSEDFRKNVEKRFKKAKKNDLCIIYLNAHGKIYDTDGDEVGDTILGVASDSEFWTHAYWADRTDFNWKEYDDKCDPYNDMWKMGPPPKDADPYWYGRGYLISGSKDYWTWRGMLDMFGQYAKGQIVFFPEVCYSGNFVDCADDCNASDRIAIVSATDDSTGSHVANWPTYFFDQSSYTNALVKGLKGHKWVKGTSKKSATKVTLKSLYTYIKKDPTIKKYKMNPKSYVGSKVLKNLVLYKK